DAEGKYRTPPLPVGGVRLTFFAPEREKGSDWVKVEPGKPGTAQDVYLTAGTTDRGPGGGEGGKAGAGAVIDPLEVAVGPGKDGRFTVIGYGPMWQPRAFVMKDGFQMSQFTPGKGAKDEVEVKLLRFGWFAGKALDAETGTPLRLERARISPGAVGAFLEQPEP